MTTPQTVKTCYIEAKNITYGYRKLGKSNEGFPLLMLHHFRAPMDVWDPLFISSIAAQREVILFDNAGVGKSTGEVPDFINGMADLVVHFLAALKASQVDIYGFSMGGYIAQQIALDHPNLIRKLILSGTGPGVGGVGSESPNVPAPNAAEVGRLATGKTPDFESIMYIYEWSLTQADV